MISLLAYATNPTVLANGSLATSDMAAAAFFVASVGCLWKMFHRLSPGTFIYTWLALASLFLSKMSALLIAPMGVALLIIRLMRHRPLVVGWKKGVALDYWLVQAGVLCGTLLLQAVLVIAAIWAFYGFRYSAFHEPLMGNERFYIPWNETLSGSGALGRAIEIPWNETLSGSGALGRAIEFARDHRLLPEA